MEAPDPEMTEARRLLNQQLYLLEYAQVLREKNPHLLEALEALSLTTDQREALYVLLEHEIVLPEQIARETVQQALAWWQELNAHDPNTDALKKELAHHDPFSYLGFEGTVGILVCGTKAVNEVVRIAHMLLRLSRLARCQ